MDTIVERNSRNVVAGSDAYYKLMLERRKVRLAIKGTNTCARLRILRVTNARLFSICLQTEVEQLMSSHYCWSRTKKSDMISPWLQRHEQKRRDHDTRKQRSVHEDRHYLAKLRTRGRCRQEEQVHSHFRFAA